MSKTYPEGHPLAGLPRAEKAKKVDRTHAATKVPHEEIVRLARPHLAAAWKESRAPKSRDIYDALNLAARGVSDAKSTGDALGNHLLGLYRDRKMCFLPCRQNWLLLIDGASADQLQAVIDATGVADAGALKEFILDAPEAKERTRTNEEGEEVGIGVYAI
ncbi:MAG: hypothetical protein RIC55_14220 [Pirellulaceae bacterium]